MSKRQILMILGVLVATFLFFGFPFFWDKIIAILLGLSVVLLTNSIKIDSQLSSKDSVNVNDSSSAQAHYVEHRNSVDSAKNDSILKNDHSDVV